MPLNSPTDTADDKDRRIVAMITFVTGFLIIVAVLAMLFFRSSDVTPAEMGIIGTIVGYKARDEGSVINYLFGSSSGSAAKSKILDQQTRGNP